MTKPPKAPNHLKEWRQSAGLTQAQVEKAEGWPASRVSNLEKGRALVTEQVLRTLGARYGCLPSQLLSAPSMPRLPPQSRSGMLAEARERLTRLVDVIGDLRAAIDAIETQIQETHLLISAAVENDAAHMAMLDSLVEKMRGR